VEKKGEKREIIRENSYKEFDNEKKFLRLENSPHPLITFLMVLP